MSCFPLRSRSPGISKRESRRQPCDCNLEVTNAMSDHGRYGRGVKKKKRNTSYSPPTASLVFQLLHVRPHHRDADPRQALAQVHRRAHQRLDPLACGLDRREFRRVTFVAGRRDVRVRGPAARCCGLGKGEEAAVDGDGAEEGEAHEDEEHPWPGLAVL